MKRRISIWIFRPYWKTDEVYAPIGCQLRETRFASFSSYRGARQICMQACDFSRYSRKKGTAIKIAVPSTFSYILMILTYNALILSNAATEFSYVPNAVSLK